MLIFALLWLAAGIGTRKLLAIASPFNPVTGLVLGYVWDNYSFSIRINRKEPGTPAGLTRR